MRGRVGRITPFRIISALLLLFLIITTLPRNHSLEFNGYKAYYPTGNFIQRNSLSFNLNPNVEGIKAEKGNGGKLELGIPYFQNKRFIVSSEYIPFIGEKRSVTELFSLTKYEYQIKDRYSKIEFTDANKGTLSLVIVLSLFLGLLTLYLPRLRNGVKLDKVLIFIFYLIFLIFARASLLITLTGALLLGVLILERRKEKFALGALFTLTLSVSFLTASAGFDYSSITDDKIAVQALNLINKPSQVPQGIEYVERLSAENGKLNMVKCHQTLHQLGMLTYLKFKDPVKTMASTITNCEFGYLHGSEDGISLLTTGVENSKETYKAGCKAIYNGENQNTFLECIHGSGHAFYELYSGDYERAYKACSIWGKNTNVCQVAVTMSLGDYLTSKGTNQNLPEQCLTVRDPKAKDSCIISAFRYVLNKPENYSNDLPKAGLFCDKLQGKLRDSCFFSIGDGLAYEMRNHFDQETVNWGRDFCSFNNVINQSCYMTFIRYMSYYHALFGKPVPVSYYCSNLPFKRESCEVELTAQVNRPAN